MMMEGRGRFGSVKAAIDMYGERILEGNTALEKSHINSSEIRKLHVARRDAGRFSESRRVAESVKSQAETELSDAKKTVKDLSARIEELNSRLKLRAADMEKLKKAKTGGASFGKTDYNGYAKVMKELGDAKREMNKLKQDMAAVSEEKRRAVEEVSGSGSKMQYCSSTIEGLQREIEEINEEIVVVELARIEAIKECRAIEAQRAEEAKKHSVLIEKMREKINGLIQQTDRAVKLETALSAANLDAKILESELKQVREMDKSIQRNAKPNLEEKESAELESINKELEAAKRALASVKEEGFKCMASMDDIRNELKRVSEEKAQCKKKNEKGDVTIQNLNAKLLRAKAKLEAASASEEKANSIASNLSLTLEQLKAGVEAAKNERVAAMEETAKVKEEIQKTNSETDLAEDKLQAAIQELKNVKSSEGIALENLRAVVEKTIRNRASKKSSKIIISTFEYEYLTGRAAMAEEIADKKVAAAEAWVKALEASEKEILMRTEMIQKETQELKAEEERSLSATAMVERELQKWENSQRKSMSTSGKLTPGRRSKYRKSASPAFRLTHRSTSFTVTGRRKVLPKIAKFFGGRSSESNM
ncbi:PREDICTED: protein PLASTID MOVEMENT IMPAIRED 2 [Ipomoea nil]|uniref:protein PLASTID MOVEMENT IMPAIRED 2 n=1 Tax=Ipomoea nil TaxID=35883 RepID=UPI000900E1E7|nr:PREDICTED: protein PLASTID MOVEMENT IMPAIRED 2 [Ipomoea nil]